MAFTIFATNDTISSSEVMDNYYLYGQDDLLPRGGASLDATNSVYDLGSSAYRWKDVHVNTTNLFGSVTGSFQRIKTWDFASTTSRIEIIGLNGDSDYEYMILANLSCAGLADNNGVYMHLNEDSSASYSYIRANISGSSSGFYLLNTQVNNKIEFNINAHLYASTGRYRQMLAWVFYGIASSASFVSLPSTYTYNNKTTTITSIQFYFATQTCDGGHIEIWARR